MKPSVLAPVLLLVLACDAATSDSPEAVSGGGKADELGCEGVPATADPECIGVFASAMTALSEQGEQCLDPEENAKTFKQMETLATFQYEVDAPDAGELSFETMVWVNPVASTGWHTAARVRVTSENGPAITYELAQANTTQWLFTTAKKDDEVTGLTCHEL